MAASSATLYFGFLIASITLWMIFSLCSRLFTWMLSLVLGMSVRFRVSSRKCLRDVVVMSETGAFESSSAGEIKFGVGFLSGELCIKVMIYDLDVVMRSSGALSCDKLTLCFQLGYDRAVGIVVIRTMEIVSGDVTMKLDNDFFSQSKRSSATSPSTKKPHKEYQLSALAKYSMYFSEKVSFSLPKLDVRCVNRKHDLFAVNNVTAIILRSIKSKSVEDSGDITRLMELNEIHLFREAESSILEIIKVDVVSFIEIPFQVWNH
ncbi:protein SABRE-like isoform X2 [Brassica napus]|uniref:protein SABRE-like isoform X2 n=1 Tax=Brassica napus TaxID=3708 RepID=UPI00207AB94F|nr:protein SABRE-like isoform X2 [Brassica napus]